MKQFACILLAALTLRASAAVVPTSDKELVAEARLVSATLFYTGVQLQNEASVAVASGKSLIKLKNISAYADEKSVQVSGDGAFTILSVNYKANPNKAEDAEEFKKIEKGIDDLDRQIREERTWIEILQKKEAFYNANLSVTGKDQIITVDQLKALGENYTKTIETIRFSIMDRLKKIDDLEEQRRKQNDKLNQLRSGQSGAGAEVWILVSSANALTAKFNISYFTYNAGWFPSYDLRVNKLNEPMDFVYKANIYQNTGLDWKNVKIRCSNATPYQQGNAPVLQPYYLYYGNYPSNNNANQPRNITQVTGVLRDSETGEALPFANIVVKGTNIGTTTDLNGEFRLNVPAGSNIIEVTFIGYERQEYSVSGGHMSLSLRPMHNELNEVVITGGQPAQMDGVSVQRMASLTPGVSGREYAKKLSLRGARADADYKTKIVNVTTQSAATSVEFEIAEPYNLKSDGQTMTVDIKQAGIPTIFEYHGSPKLEASAFLIARIPGWEKFSLLSGEANLYIENTYVGKSYLNAEQVSDTLDISLGRDKNVVVKREKVKDFTEKQFLGSNKTVTRGWKITVKNNKSSACQIFINDQVPYTENKDISVDVVEITGNLKPNPANGLVRWKLELQPNEAKELNLKYAVKYPKNATLFVD